LHFIFPPLLYEKITLAQHSIYGSLVALRSPKFFPLRSAKHRISQTLSDIFVLDF